MADKRERKIDPAAPRALARAVPMPEGLNQLETRYAHHLTRRQFDGEILEWRAHAIQLQGAKRTWSRPDFLVTTAARGLEVHEVKGPHVWEDSRVKTKLMASLWPEFQFVVVKETARGVFALEYLP